MTRKRTPRVERKATGWDHEMCQDVDKQLFRWFASRPGAIRLINERAQRIRKS